MGDVYDFMRLSGACCRGTADSMAYFFLIPNIGAQHKSKLLQALAIFLFLV